MPRFVRAAARAAGRRLVPAAAVLALAWAAAGARAETPAELYRRHAALEQQVTDEGARLQTGRGDASAYQALVVQSRFAQNAIESELRTRSRAGETEAAHYLGVVRWDAGDLLAASLEGLAPEARARLVAQAETAWREARGAFEAAAGAGHAGAAWNLARMTELGRGAAPAPGAAARWYLAAGDAWLAQGDREGALRALAALERVDPMRAAGLRERLNPSNKTPGHTGPAKP